MIDTIGLSLPYGTYTIFNSSSFKPTFNKINHRDIEQLIQFMKEHKGLKKYILNPKQSAKEQGLIYPNVTIYETSKGIGRYQCNLKPHVSIPKLLFGHSIEEVNNSNYQQAVTTLQSRLKEMGVSVFEKAIHEAEATTLHYCINILMSSEADVRRFLNAMSRMTIDDRYENHSRDYGNGGKAVRFHSKAFELIAYMKYYDFIDTSKYRIDRKTTLQEKEIVNKLSITKNIPPLLRIEIRFNGKPTIRKHLRTIIGIDKQIWTFKEVFNEEISRKVIKYYWTRLMNNPMNRLMLTEVSKDDLNHKLTESFSNIPQRIIDSTLGMYDRLKSQGAYVYKEELQKKYSRGKWYKDQQKIVNFLEKINIQGNTDLIDLVTSAIDRKPIQLGLPI